MSCFLFVLKHKRTKLQILFISHGKLRSTVFDLYIRAVMGVGFLVPDPSHTRRKKLWELPYNSHKIPTNSPYSMNPEIFHIYTPHLASFRWMHDSAVSHDIVFVCAVVFLLSDVEDKPIHKRGGLQVISQLLFIELSPSLTPTKLKCLILIIGISDTTRHMLWVSETDELWQC